MKKKRKNKEMFDFNKVSVFNQSAAYVNEDGELTTDIEAQIEYAARVSNPSANKITKEPGRLTRYLMENDHWSPLEMASVTLKIETTRDIARQLLRHRSFSFQEFSQRYADVRDIADSAVIKDARSQDLKNRQNSNDDMDDYDKAWWNNSQEILSKSIFDLYEEAIEKGIAKEVARVILPEGMTPSILYCSGTVRSWFHYVQLRTGNGTQLEHQDLANKCLVELHSLMPNIFSEKNIRKEK